MRRGSGPCTRSPSIRTSPAVGFRNPARMFSRVDFPQPEGPSRHTNSPSCASRPTSSSTLVVAPSRWKLIDTPVARSLISSPRGCANGVTAMLILGVPPPYGSELFERPHACVEQQANEPDQHHARDHEVVPVPSVAGIGDQESEAGIDSDHLGGDDDQPR